MNRSIVVLSLVLFGAAWSVTGSAQTYPNKTIKMILPAAAGTAPDIVGRVVAERLTEGLGQTVIVENRPGAGGTIGTGIAAKAAPDGYTLLLGTAAFLAVSPALFASVSYDPVNSFAPISMVGTNTYVMVVSPAVPARSVRELIDLAKSKPGHLNYGASTIGTPSHLVMEMFKKAAGVDIVGVNYIGSAQAVTALLAGNVQIVVEALGSQVLPQIAAGKVRPLAVTSAKRVRHLPDVPPVWEAGLPGFEADGWFGLLAPSGTPNEIIRRLHAETVTAIGRRELADTLDRLGVAPVHSTPDEFLALLKSEAVKWAAAVRMSGAKAQ